MEKLIKKLEEIQGKIDKKEEELSNSKSEIFSLIVDNEIKKLIVEFNKTLKKIVLKGDLEYSKALESKEQMLESIKQTKEEIQFLLENPIDKKVDKKILNLYRGVLFFKEELLDAMEEAQDPEKILDLNIQLSKIELKLSNLIIKWELKKYESK